MKDFLSEYGFAILAAIVVILLIAMCTPVGNLIKNQVMGVVDSFATKTESKLYSMDASNEVGIILKQIDDEGKFSITATSDSETDTLNAEYRVKDQNGNWSEWRVLGPLSTGSKEHTGSFTAKIENGNKAQVRVTDEGKADNLYYESNIIEYTGVSSQTESFEGNDSEEETITFFISIGYFDNFIEYTANVGQTWGEWIEEANLESFEIVGSNIVADGLWESIGIEITDVIENTYYRFNQLI